MKPKFFIILLVVSDFLLGLFLLLYGKNFAIFNPAGPIAAQEKHIMLLFIALSLAIVIPLFITFFLIISRYRENKKAVYRPEETASHRFQLLWWIAPTIIVLCLSTLAWKYTHELDPYKPLESEAKPITIQVVALRWKWLFIYPEQGIATVNFIQFPEKTPIIFELTADAPMNSFWIPQLGGQMYAMTGMGTKLHLLADKPGDYAGSAAEINGAGFAGMRFIARASSPSEFDTWVKTVKQSPRNLTMEEYNRLMKPTEHTPVMVYATAEPQLYDKVMLKYLPPPGDVRAAHDMHKMEMD